MHRVLVVSRNPAMAMGLSSADYDVLDLRPARFQDWIADGASGVDVLVVDLDDPNAALAAMRTLRASGAHIPVLIVSSAHEGWDSPELAAINDARVLALPISRPSLLAALDSLLLPAQGSGGAADDESVLGPESGTGDQSPFDAPSRPLERDKLERVLSEIDADAAHDVPDEEVPIIGPAPSLRLVTPAAIPPPPVGFDDVVTPTLGEEAEGAPIGEPEAGAPPDEEFQFDEGAVDNPRVDDLAYETERRQLPGDAITVHSGHGEPDLGDDAGSGQAATEDSQPSPLGVALLNRNRSRWQASPARPARPSRQPAALVDVPEPIEQPAQQPAQQPALEPAREPAQESSVPAEPMQGRAVLPEPVHPPAPSIAPAVALVREIQGRLDELYSVAETAEVVIDTAVEQTEAEAGAVLVPDGAHWKVVAGFGLRPLEYRYELSPASWLVQEIAQGGRALIIEDTDIARQPLQGAPLASWRHLLVAPIRLVDGILLVARERNTSFSEAELRRLAALIDEAAPLLEAAVEVRSLSRDLSRLTAEDNTP